MSEVVSKDPFSLTQLKCHLCEDLPDFPHQPHCFRLTHTADLSVVICMHFSSLLLTKSKSALSQHFGSFELLENIYQTNMEEGHF